jgi:serine/threonine-protein kinase PRP4
MHAPPIFLPDVIANEAHIVVQLLVRASMSRVVRHGSSHEGGKRARFEDEVESGQLTEAEETDYELDDEEKEEREREARRKRRKAILERHRGSDVVESMPDPSNGETNMNATAPSVTKLADASDEQGIALTKVDGTRPSRTPAVEEMAAADYTSAIDHELDVERERGRLRKDEGPQSPSDIKPRPEDTDDFEYIEVSEDDDDLDDMFAIKDEVKEKKRRLIKVPKVRVVPATGSSSAIVTEIPQIDSALHDNWDDAEGYYKIVLGERIGQGGRYHVFATLGQGMFSAVVRARDTQQDDREVAIKVIRSQESMYKAGLKEITMLNRLAGLDPDDKKHVIRLLGHFDHRNHLCMVFESLSMNLREVVKRFGKDVGLNLRAVRAYAHQIFLALGVMRKAEIIHADLKPDNILVNESKAVVKVCDLGSASDLSEMEITPYLVSRFYRAPEIILGLPYDCALDMWSIGCTLYELYTGRILFPGKSNNHMLLLVQELRGKFTTKQIRKARFSGLHFDDQNAFVSRERDRTSGADVLRKVASFNPTAAKTDLRSRILPDNAIKGLSQSDVRLTNSFIDLLGRTLELDPARRITPTQALQHPFFS